MLINKTLAAILIIGLFFGNILAQESATPKYEVSPELQKNAVDLLRQTIKEIPTLKNEENRRYFTIKTARLLWKYDEPQARVMFEGEITILKKVFLK